MGNYLIPNNIKNHRTLVSNPDTSDNGSTVFPWNFSLTRDTNQDHQISICPKNFMMMMDDISFQSGKFAYTDFYNDIPKIRIREYLMDLPEDRWLDILVQTYKDMEEQFKKLRDDPQKYKFVFNTNVLIDAIKNFINGMYDKVQTNSPYPFQNNSGDVDRQFYYDFVVFVYRKLISYDVTNNYTLPYSGTINIGSNGGNGWGRGKLIEGLRIISDINIDRVPMWKYDGQNGDVINFELNLFNDTIDAAYANFMFLHTIIPNNMWLQYGVFQHNPCVYDIQFDGGLRYFCCSLDVKCENIGNNRIPPKSFFETVTWDKTINKQELRIPDAYKFTFSFKSLLPNNFNQYMMTYHEKDSIIDDAYQRQETSSKDIATVVTDAIKNSIC